MSDNNPLYFVRINTSIDNNGTHLFFYEDFLVNRLDIKYITTLGCQTILTITINEVAEEAKKFMLDNFHLVEDDAISYGEFYDIYNDDSNGLEKEVLEKNFRSNQSFCDSFFVKKLK